MKKNNLLKFTVLLGLLFFAIFAISSPLTADAQRGYTSFVEIKGLTDTASFAGKDGTPDLTVFLSSIYTYTISFAALLAVLMISIGGFQYLSSAAAGSKEAAKERILNTIYGLILILFSYIILYTINPEVFRFRIFEGASERKAQDEQTALEKAGVGYKYTFSDTLDPSGKILTSQIFAKRPACEEGRILKEGTDLVPKYSQVTCEEVNSKGYSFTYDAYTAPDSLYMSSIDTLSWETDANGFQIRPSKLVTSLPTDEISCKKAEAKIRETVLRPYKPTRQCVNENDPIINGGEDNYVFVYQYDGGKEYLSPGFATFESCKAVVDTMVGTRSENNDAFAEYYEVTSSCEPQDTPSFCVDATLRNGNKDDLEPQCFIEPTPTKCEEAADYLRNKQTSKYITYSCAN